MLTRGHRVKRGGKAPAIFRQAIRPRLVAMLREERRRIAENGPHAATERRSQLQDALTWIDGGSARADFKIEARQREGRWRLVMLAGLLGYSASDPLLTVEDI